jgi:hypothetical protein
MYAVPDLSLARQIARRLIERAAVAAGGSGTAARAAVAASDHLYPELSRWVGADGAHALFTRARAHAQTDHPLLGKIQLHARSEPYLEGVVEAIEAYGATATAEAIESMLVGLIELLGRLIGDDMAMKMIEGISPNPARRGNSRT